MNNALLTIISLLLASNCIILVFLVLKLRALVQNIMVFLLPTAPGEQSPMAKSLYLLAANVAKEISTSLAASFMGQKSGQLRGENAVMADMTTDLLSQSSPLLAGLASMFPSVVKRISKNPALAQFALGKITELLSKKGLPPADNGQKETSVLDKLKQE